MCLDVFTHRNTSFHKRRFFLCYFVSYKITHFVCVLWVQMSCVYTLWHHVHKQDMSFLMCTDVLHTQDASSFTRADVVGVNTSSSNTYTECVIFHVYRCFTYTICVVFKHILITYTYRMCHFLCVLMVRIYGMCREFFVYII